MKSRSERYEEKSNIVKPRLTRTKKNSYLYDDMNNKIGLEVVDINSGNGLDLSSILNKHDAVKPNDAKDDKTFEKIEVDNDDERVFDVNSVLEEAKKNRVETDELEKKRKLKNDEYNVLSNLNKKYITDKAKVDNDIDEEELKELIDTITSNTLTNDLKEKDLFSDLMATNTDINFDDATAKTGEMDKVQKTEDGHLINSFYTKSMDLTEQDFDMSDDFVEKRSKKKVVIIVVVILILLALIAGGIYFVLKWKNII